jgi:hypothetical protein
VSVAGLVDDQRVDRRETLERFGVLDEDAGGRAAPRHIDELGVRLIVQGHSPGLQRHPAQRTGPR